MRTKEVEQAKLQGKILVPLRRGDRIEDMIPYIEQIAWPGCRVMLLIHYSVEGLIGSKVNQRRL